MDKTYELRFVYDRDMSGGTDVSIKIDSPNRPSHRMWDEEEIGDEVYWKISDERNYYLIRKRFLCAITIEEIQ